LPVLWCNRTRRRMTTTHYLLVLLLTGAAAKSTVSCGGAVSSLADASLTKWIHDAEANVSTGSYHVVLGGDRAAHAGALKCALRTAAKAAGAPPHAFGHVLDVACESDACGEGAFDQVTAFLKKRRGKYGVVLFQQRAPLWLLKTSAAYFWGQSTCGHATLEETFDCARLVWAVSTDLAGEALASESDAAMDGAALDKRVQDAARTLWPSRVAGALAQKAQRRAVFVRGGLDGPAPFLQRVATYFKRHKRSGDALDHVAGQTEAVAAVRRAVDLARARAATPVVDAPPAAFFLYGAPGTGKTRLAEAAAEMLGYPLHRLAMESYASVEDANALFGAPPGLQQGVCLVDILVDTPRAVVVFDEVEKAHPSLFREKLHSALSSGTMTHKRDHTKVARLSETFFFFTSNCFEDAVVEASLDDPLTLREVLSRAINDAPRIPCSQSRQNPFEDASLRSRLGRSRQYPFAPLDRNSMGVAVAAALERAALRFGLDDLAWSPELTMAYTLKYLGDARAAAQQVTDDLEQALHAAGPRPRRSTGAVFHLKPAAGPWTADDSSDNGGVGLAWLSAEGGTAAVVGVRTPKKNPVVIQRKPVATLAKRAAVAPQPAVQPAQALDASAATAAAVACVVAALALRALLLAAYAVAWYVALFSVVGLAAMCFVLGPLEALAVAVAVAKVAATVAVTVWRGLRLFMASGGAGPVALALVLGLCGPRFVLGRRRETIQTATRGTMTDPRKNRFHDRTRPPPRSQSVGATPSPPPPSRVVEA